MGSGLLRTLDNSQGVDKNAGVTVTQGDYFSMDGSSVYTREKTKAPKFETAPAQINRIGRGNGTWKFIVEKSTFPFEITEDNVGDLKNIGVVMKWKHRTRNEVIDAASYVELAEMADDGNRIALYVASTFKLPASVISFDNADYKITMDVYHDSPRDAKVGVTIGETIEIEKVDFEPVELKLNTRGRDGVNWRFVADLESIPFKVGEDSMVGMKVAAVFSHKSDGSVKVLNSTVIRNEMRDDGTSVTLVVPATDSVPMKNSDGSVFDDAPYNVQFILAPVDYSGKFDVPEEKEPTVKEVPKLEFKPFELKIITKGRSSDAWRYVVENSSLPFDVSEGCMKGLNVKAVYTHKANGEERILESTVRTNEMRADGVSTTVVVPATKEVPIRLEDGSVFDDSQYDVKVTLSPIK